MDVLERFREDAVSVVAGRPSGLASQRPAIDAFCLTATLVGEYKNASRWEDARMLQVGESAPDFTAHPHDGGTLRLKGSV